MVTVVSAVILHPVGGLEISPVTRFCDLLIYTSCFEFFGTSVEQFSYCTSNKYLRDLNCRACPTSSFFGLIANNLRRLSNGTGLNVSFATFQVTYICIVYIYR